MNKKELFVHKLINKMDKVDPDTLKSYVCDLAEGQTIFRHMMNEIEDGILLIDKDQTILFENTAAQNLLGIPYRDQDKKTSIDDIQDDYFKEYVKNYLSGSTENVIEDLTLLIPNEIQIRAHLKQLQAPANSTLIVVKDISQFKAPQEWEDKIARIESLVKLAAGVAHEIGNPLNSIGIHMQMLSQMVSKLPEKEQKPLKESVDVITAETSRLDRIIRHFLKATRKPPIRFKIEDLNQLLNDAIQFLLPELESKKISVELDLDEKLPHFMMDRERLHQAFLNIIKNAVEAMPSGGQLNIRVSHKAKLARIVFQDTGLGIAEDDLPHIFDAYFTTKAEGHGLGLMTVFDAVRDHGGRVEAESKLNQGTIISLLIPIRQPKLQLPDNQITKEQE